MTTVNNLQQRSRNITLQYLGDHWNEFETGIPAAHIELYEKIIAVIMTAYPDSLFPTQFVELTMDESLGYEEKSMALRYIFLDQLTEIINKIGIWLNKDFVEVKHLPELVEIADLFFYMTEISDAENTLLPLIAATDNSPKYRFIHTLCKVIYPEEEEPDTSEYECLIDDVSEDTLRALEDSITLQDRHDIPPDMVIVRVQANSELLNNTLAYTHVRNNGSLCASVESYIGFYKAELDKILEDESIPSAVQYGREIIAFHLISNFNDEQIKNHLLTYFDGRVDNLVANFQIINMVNKLILNVPNSGANNE